MKKFLILVALVVVAGCSYYSLSGIRWENIRWDLQEYEITPMFQKKVTDTGIYELDGEIKIHESNLQSYLGETTDTITEDFIMCLADKGILEITPDFLEYISGLHELFLDGSFVCEAYDGFCGGTAAYPNVLISVVGSNDGWPTIQCHEEGHTFGFSHADYYGWEGGNPDIQYCFERCGNYLNQNAPASGVEVREFADLSEEGMPDSGLSEEEKEEFCEEFETGKIDWLKQKPSYCD